MKGNVEYTMIGSSAQHQVKRFILIFVILIIIYHLRLIQINPWPMLPLLQNVQPACGPIVTPKALDPAGRVSHTWNHIQDLFIVHKPEPELQHVNFPEGPDSGSWENRKDYLKITYMEAAAMRTMHSHLVNQLPSFPKGEYSGRGIVLVAGGRYSEFASTSLGMLRLVGSRVPVEVWMVDPSEERAGWCDQLAREGMGCRFLSDYIADMSMFESAYQYKTLVLLFSSFTEVLFLDSDNLPLINPDSIFDSSVYKKTGAVLWPDYWKTSESPFTPFITGETEEPSENAIAFQTVDSGMMLWNKQRHWTTLCLSAYYNYHGPKYFYTLITQGGAGFGDKDTFPTALRALSAPWTLITHPLRTQYVNSGDGHRFGSGFAMMQADPWDEQSFNPMFLHSNFVKLSVRRLMCSNCTEDVSALTPEQQATGQTYTFRGYYQKDTPVGQALTEHRRMFATKVGAVDDFMGVLDAERDIWRVMERDACFGVWADDETCQRTRLHIDAAFGPTDEYREPPIPPSCWESSLKSKANTTEVWLSGKK